MDIIDSIIEKNSDAIYKKINDIINEKLSEIKKNIAQNFFNEAYTRNPNIVRMGKISRIRRRFRRNAKGRIVLQKNRRRSNIKGYKIKGNRLQRIPTIARLKKARLLKRSWKTTRRAKLRRSLLKRKLTMRRRQSMGLR